MEITNDPIKTSFTLMRIQLTYKKLISGYSSLLLFLLVGSSISLNAQETWEQTKNEDGIKVYTRKKVGERFKEIKIVTSTKTTLNEIMASFDDVESHKDWVYKTPESKVIERVDPSTLIYYVKSNLPYPVKDRDIVIHYAWEQDPLSKVITTRSKALPGKFDPVQSTVRVKEFQSKYVLTPKPNGIIHIEYEAKMDPAGSLPAWLVNMAVSKGPVKTMKAFFKLLDSDKYKGIKVAGVEELGE